MKYIAIVYAMKPSFGAEMPAELFYHCSVTTPDQQVAVRYQTGHGRTIQKNKGRFTISTALPHRGGGREDTKKKSR